MKGKICLFTGYYVLQILLGLLAIVAICLLTIHIPWLFLVKLHFFTSMIVAALWVGVCCMALFIAGYLISPLFSDYHSPLPDNAREVEREDCPLLFERIDEIVKHVGTSKPLHVYLTADVNACVFYRTSFWNIFFPVRKNLAVGLGLFDNLTEAELVSVLAHEFGHFSQKTTKVDSAVYVTIQVIHNLVYSSNSWDDLLEKWVQLREKQNSMAQAFAFSGGIARLVVEAIRRFNAKMYCFVDKSYMKLSRQLEYDADAVSCRYVGSQVLVSALCKIDVNARNRQQYIELLDALFRESKRMKNFFVGEQIWYAQLRKEGETTIQVSSVLDKPFLSEEEGHSRLKIDNAAASHPALEDRIAQAREYTGGAIFREGESPAWGMVPETMSLIISTSFFLHRYGQLSHVTIISDEEFRQWVDKVLEFNRDPLRIRLFFSAGLPDFTDPTDVPVENPFTDENRNLILDYLAAEDDYNTLVGIARGDIEADRIIFDGKEIDSRHFPLKEQEAYVKQLEEKVRLVMRDAFSFVFQHLSEEDKKEALQLLADRRYSLAMLNDALQQLIACRDQAYGELDEQDRPTNENQVAIARLSFEEYAKPLQHVLRNRCNWEILDRWLDKESVDYFHWLADHVLDINPSENGEILQQIYRLPDRLWELHCTIFKNAVQQWRNKVEQTLNILKVPNQELSL